jgi:hypothetical protein
MTPDSQFQVSHETLQPPHPGPDPGSPVVVGDSCFRRNEEIGEAAMNPDLQ